MKAINYKLLCLLMWLCIPMCMSAQHTVSANTPPAIDTLNVDYAFKLYGQTRRYNMRINKTPGGGAQIDWCIFSYQKWLTGSYLISPQGFCCGDKLNFKQPQNGMREQLNDDETFGMISVSAFEALQKNGVYVYDNTTYRLKGKQNLTIGDKTLETLHAIADIDETEMWIWNNKSYPIICRIEKNPLEINFSIERLSF